MMLLPQNAPDAIKNVAYMVDEIWYHAGDTSTDVRINSRHVCGSIHNGTTCPGECMCVVMG